MRRHIPPLDGLRAVACLAVVGFHEAHQWVPLGGWLGVDMFFVLSGFLITGLLIREHEAADRIDLRAFWLRRAGRILPPLAVLCVATLALGQVGLVDSSPADVASAAAFYADLWIANHSMEQVGPTWSLAIEEQFYLLWPLVMIAARTRARIVTVCAVAGVASYVVCWTWWGGPFSPFAHAWELLAGSALACMPSVRRWRSATPAGVAVLVAVMVPAGGFERAQPGSALAMLATVAGTILLIHGATVPGRINELLSSRVAAWVGHRSYGIYLYHLLAYRLVSHVPEMRRMVLFPVGLALTLAVAAVSFRWLEAPTRRWVADRLGSPRARVVV